MISQKHIAPSFLQFLTMSILVGVMILQPGLLTRGFMDQNSYALPDIENEDDTTEKEQHEDETKNEKKVLQTVSLIDSVFFDTKSSHVFSGLSILRGIILETHLPPPK
ncbi:MAG: translation initiation factor 2 gamma subunit (eIF-2gamma) [Flavobacteriales bacterium]|jgi:translation initiation factor 2 gamma subunit (eIF-2gamma)